MLPKPSTRKCVLASSRTVGCRPSGRSHHVASTRSCRVTSVTASAELADVQQCAASRQHSRRTPIVVARRSSLGQSRRLASSAGSQYRSRTPPRPSTADAITILRQGRSHAAALEPAEVAAQQEQQQRRVEERRDRRAEREAAVAHERRTSMMFSAALTSTVATLTITGVRFLPERVERGRRDPDHRVAEQPERVELQRGGRGGRVGRGERAALEDQAHDRRARARSGRPWPARSASASATGRRRWCCARRACRPVARVTRDGRQRRGGDRDAEQADRQVHQPERVVQPRHRARALAGRQHGVHEHVDLRGGERRWCPAP